MASPPATRLCPRCKKPLPRPRPHSTLAPRCPSCGIRAPAAKPPPAKAGRPVPSRRSAPPPKKNKTLVLAAAGGGAALLVIAVIVGVVMNGTKKPPKKEEATAPETRPEPAKTAPEVASPPPEQRPADDTVASRRRVRLAQERVQKTLDKDRDIDFAALLAMLEEVRSEAKALDIEHSIDGSVEEVKGRAAQGVERAFEPTLRKVEEHLKAGEAAKAREALAAWSLPKELNLPGLKPARLAPLEEAIAARVDLDAIRASLAAKEPLAGPLEDRLRALASSKHSDVAEEAGKLLSEAGRTRAMASSLGLLKKELEERRSAAQANVERARGSIAEKRRQEEERLTRWRAALQAGSKRAPFTVRDFYPTMEGEMAARPVHVMEFEPDQIVFGHESWGRIPIALPRIAPDIYTRLSKWALKEGDGRDHLEFGMLCMRGGALDRADQCFRQALKLDTALTPVTPDVVRIRRGYASVNGEVELTGGKLKLVYGFDRPDEAKDFSAQMAKMEVAADGGVLKLTGSRQPVATLKSLPFARELLFRAVPTKASGATHVAGLVITNAEGLTDMLLVEANGTDGKLRVASGLPQNRKLIAEAPLSAGAPVEIDWDGDGIDVSQGTAEVWNGKLTDVETLLAFVGGVGDTSFEEIRLEGGLPPEAIGRLLAERSVVLEQEMSKADRITEEEKKAVAMRPKIEPFPQGRIRPHALEQKLSAELPEDVAALLEEARRSLQKPGAQAVPEALDLYGRVIEAAPRFLFGHYYRAELRAITGDLKGALADLEALAKLEPDFVEAQNARAQVMMATRDYDGALAACTAALGSVPDLPSIFMQRALLRYYRDERKEALEDLDLALALDPTDLAARQMSKRIRNAVIGPRWKESAKLETEHYLLMREIPPPPPPGSTGLPADRKKKAKAPGSGRKEVEARLKEFGSHLEAARGWYVKAMGRDPGLNARKPIVLVFETPEGYYSYADFTAADRLEFSIGVYHSLYKQLVFFEDLDRKDTLQTMAHEGFHQFLDGLAPGAPTWFNEGTAEYLSGIEVKDGKVVRTGVLLRGRLRNLQSALKAGTQPMPFDFIMMESQRMFYAMNAPFQYAQAWSMIHFFMEGGNPEYRQCYQDYANLILDGASPLKALRETFGKRDLALMQSEWLAYVTKLKE